MLLDLTLPDGDGIAALPWLREAVPAARLVALSADESIDSVMAAINAGAAGFIPKSIESGAMQLGVSSADAYLEHWAATDGDRPGTARAVGAAIVAELEERFSEYSARSFHRA